LKPQTPNSSNNNDTINKSHHKKSYSNVNPSDIKELYNSNNNMSINNKPLNKTYNNSYNPYRNSKLAKHSSTIDDTEPVKLEHEISSNSNNNEQINNNNEPINPLNNELNLNYGANEINNQSNRNDMVITNNDQSSADEKIITSSNSITNLNLNHEMAQMNDTYKFMKKQQHMTCHNRSHSVGADPFNNNSIVTQEKYLSLINGSAIPNNISSVVMDNPLNSPNTTTNIDTSSKVPSLTSIDTPVPTGSTPSLEINQPHTNSNILNIHLGPNNTNNKRISKSYFSLSNLNNASSLNVSSIENQSNKMINDNSFCENQSFSISQSTIRKDNHRKSIGNDSIFDDEISFNNGVGEIINIDDTKENAVIVSEGNNDIDTNEIIYINENEGEKINKIEIVEIIENETTTQNIDNTTEIENIDEIEKELECEIINKIDLPDSTGIKEEGVSTAVLKSKVKGKEKMEEYDEKENRSDRTPTLSYKVEKESNNQHNDQKFEKNQEILNNEINPPVLNKPDLNVESKTVKRSKSINIFKSHERSRSLTDMRFDKKYFLGIIFNKKDSNNSRKNSNGQSSSSSSNKKTSSANSDSKSVRSNSSHKSTDGSLKESYNLPFNIQEYNYNEFIKLNSPIVDPKLQRRHSISSPEKTALDHTIYNKEEKKETIRTGTIPRSYEKKNFNIQHKNDELPLVPMKKDNEEIHTSLFNVSSLSIGSSEGNEKNNTSHSQSSRYSSTSSQLRKERLILGNQINPEEIHENNATIKPTSPKIINDTPIEIEKPQSNPVSTTPIPENTENNILNKELSEISVTNGAHSSKEHILNNLDKIPNKNLPINNSTDFENIPTYLDLEAHDKNKEDNNYLKNDPLYDEDDNSNGSIMALINKNWKLLSEDYDENENAIMISSPSQKNNDNNNLLKPISSCKFK